MLFPNRQWITASNRELLRQLVLHAYWLDTFKAFDKNFCYKKKVGKAQRCCWMLWATRHTRELSISMLSNRCGEVDVIICTSKQSRGIFPTKTSQPRAGGGWSDGQFGGGPYLRCPLSCTSGYPVRSSSSCRAVSFVVPDTAVSFDGDDDCTVPVFVVVVVDSAPLSAIVGRYDRQTAIASARCRWGRSDDDSWTWDNRRSPRLHTCTWRTTSRNAVGTSLDVCALTMWVPLSGTTYILYHHTVNMTMYLYSATTFRLSITAMSILGEFLFISWTRSGRSFRLRPAKKNGEIGVRPGSLKQMQLKEARPIQCHAWIELTHMCMKALSGTTVSACRPTSDAITCIYSQCSSIVQTREVRRGVRPHCSSEPATGPPITLSVTCSQSGHQPSSSGLAAPAMPTKTNLASNDQARPSAAQPMPQLGQRRTVLIGVNLWRRLCPAKDLPLCDDDETVILNRSVAVNKYCKTLNFGHP